MRVPRSEIPKSIIIKDNTIVTFTVESMEKAQTQGQGKLPAGCKMYKVSLRIEEPPEWADLLLYDNFTIGTADDPQAKLPETWTRAQAVGARNLNTFLDKIGVTTEEEEDWPDEALDQRAKALVSEETPKEGRYAGITRNKVSRYFSMDEETPEVATGRAARPRPAARATAGNGEDRQPPPPAAAKRTPPPPARAAAPAPSKGPAKIAKGQQLLPCGLCDPTTPRFTREELVEHVKVCGTEAAPQDE